VSFRKMRVRRGSPSRITAITTDCPSGAQAGLPRNASESARSLICEPSVSIMYNRVLLPSSTEGDVPPIGRNRVVLTVALVGFGIFDVVMRCGN
jgi:hypothetical protein